MPTCHRVDYVVWTLRQPVGSRVAAASACDTARVNLLDTDRRGRDTLLSAAPWLLLAIGPGPFVHNVVVDLPLRMPTSLWITQVGLSSDPRRMMSVLLSDPDGVRVLDVSLLLPDDVPGEWERCKRAISDAFWILPQTTYLGCCAHCGGACDGRHVDECDQCA